MARMRHALYGELTPWYRMLDAPEDHEDECDQYIEVFEGAIEAPRTMLELGAGAGNNGLWLKRRFACTLSDLSEPMLALSREINPECEHVLGDMRTLRLGRTFDAVLVHDAIVYMTSEADLRAALETAFVHLRPGGAAIFAPDTLRECFREGTELHEREEGPRSLRCLAWDWDPDPNDDTQVTEYAFLLRDGTTMTAVHDSHVSGLFARATWMRLLADVGFTTTTFERELEEQADSGYTDEVFLARRP
jgi:hypothetical protein